MIDWLIDWKRRSFICAINNQNIIKTITNLFKIANDLKLIHLLLDMKELKEESLFLGKTKHKY